MLSVTDFGARGDGIANDTDAIQAAITAANRGTIQSGSFGSAPTVFFPVGRYRVTAPVTVFHYQRLLGEQAIILGDNKDVDIFTLIYTCRIEGLLFEGGHRAISIATNNLGDTLINIHHCEFWDQTGAAIHTDNNSSSTLLNIRDCRIQNLNASAFVLDLNSGDTVNFHNSWVSSDCDEAFRVQNAVLNMDRMFGVPVSTGGKTWVRQNPGSSIRLSNCRFGGENSGHVAVKCFAPPNLDPNYLIVENCDIYSP